MLQMPGTRGREVLRSLLRAEHFGKAPTSCMITLVVLAGALTSGAGVKVSSSLKLRVRQAPDVNAGIVLGGHAKAAWSSS